VPLRVIGAGFGPCDHMQELFRDSEHARLWDAAVRGELSDWAEIFAGYRATVDWPGCAFYEELTARYPDAKVLLAVRTADRWYESARKTIYNTRKPILPLLVLYPAVMLVPRMRRMISLVNRLIWEETFRGNFEDRRHAIGIFERHNREVIERVPAERLPVYDIKDGWGLLCEFLGVEKPDKPFPHINDSGTFRRVVLWLSVAEVLVGVLGASLTLSNLRGRLRGSHR
jgi:hypothetical protein